MIFMFSISITGMKLNSWHMCFPDKKQLLVADNNYDRLSCGKNPSVKSVYMISSASVSASRAWRNHRQAARTQCPPVLS